VTQQLFEATPNGSGPKYLIRDNDDKYGVLFDRVAEASGIEVMGILYRAPRANAVCERFLGGGRHECLDHLLIFSDQQLYRVMKEYVGYVNRARPHQGLRKRFRGSQGARRLREGKERSSPSLCSIACILIIGVQPSE